MKEALNDLIAAVAVLIITIVFRGLVFMLFWKWFIVSCFNVPAVTIAQGSGIALLVSVFTNRVKEKEQDKDITDYIKSIGLDLAILFTGWIIYQFV